MAAPPITRTSSPLDLKCAIECRALADISRIRRPGKHGFHCRWSRVVSKHSTLHVRAEPLLEPRVCLPGKSLNNHALHVGNIWKMTEE